MTGLIFVVALLAQNDGPTIPSLPNVNADLLKLVAEDQWDRGIDMFGKGARHSGAVDWKVVTPRDEARQKAVHELLDAGRVQSADDFRYASLIFQHSNLPADLMQAHVLSTMAVSKGGSGRWLMAATLDRYLHSTGKPQIFGTQFYSMDGKTWTMEPYNRAVVTDSVRALWCVIPIEKQNALLEEYQKGKGGSTTIPNCEAKQ